MKFALEKYNRGLMTTVWKTREKMLGSRILQELRQDVAMSYWTLLNGSHLSADVLRSREISFIDLVSIDHEREWVEHTFIETLSIQNFQQFQTLFSQLTFDSLKLLAISHNLPVEFPEFDLPQTINQHNIDNLSDYILEESISATVAIQSPDGFKSKLSRDMSEVVFHSEKLITNLMLIHLIHQGILDETLLEKHIMDPGSFTQNQVQKIINSIFDNKQSFLDLVSTYLFLPAKIEMQEVSTELNIVELNQLGLWLISQIQHDQNYLNLLERFYPVRHEGESIVITLNDNGKLPIAICLLLPQKIAISAASIVPHRLQNLIGVTLRQTAMDNQQGFFEQEGMQLADSLHTPEFTFEINR